MEANPRREIPFGSLVRPSCIAGSFGMVSKQHPTFQVVPLKLHGTCAAVVDFPFVHRERHFMAARSVLRHAPYLRRYARALTGSQSEGDGFVRATLESLIGSEQKLAGVLPVRVALFRAFHATWRKA